MKLIIEIPKEFEAHFADDRFKDSLERLKADAGSVAWNYEIELADMLIEAFKDAKEVIMCKDCDNLIWIIDEISKGWCAICNRPVHYNDYCSFGERGENETN